MRVDYLIIGQGVSGTFLSWYLIRQGATVMIIDENKSNTASKVAAGLINPVTGRRLVKSWMIDELMPFAKEAYSMIGAELNIQCIRETSLLQFFNAPDVEQAFRKRLSEEPDYLALPDDKDWRPVFDYPFGWGIIEPCYIADLAGLITAHRARLADEGQLIEERFIASDLIVNSKEVSYRNIIADKIIFCDGESAMLNPWFSRLPFSLNKGEALTLEIPELSCGHIYKFRHTLIPVDVEASLFWFGSSYEWTYEDDQPSEKFRREAEAELKRFLKLPFTIVDHLAAIRPANVERRPFVGLHPANPQIGILNGMGTKGCSLAPYFAKQMAERLTGGKPLLPEVDVNRFRRVLAD
ncbi:MAG TPA: FAD-binding oxidoreductase [Chitinophagaceae bacterium]